jgi:hypothetical protein
MLGKRFQQRRKLESGAGERGILRSEGAERKKRKSQNPHASKTEAGGTPTLLER